jgi:hypothetical protein
MLVDLIQRLLGKPDAPNTNTYARVEQTTAAPGEKRATRIPVRWEEQCQVLDDVMNVRCQKKYGHIGNHANYSQSTDILW